MQNDSSTTHQELMQPLSVPATPKPQAGMELSAEPPVRMREPDVDKELSALMQALLSGEGAWYGWSGRGQAWDPG
jgi:hypothetical protein